MAVSAAAPHEAHTATGLDNRKLGMWAFLGSECLFFGALITAYMLYRNASVVRPHPHELYDIPFTSVSSFVLLMSSLTMVLALSAIQRGEDQKLRVWLLATAMLGLTFLGGQVYEFTAFWNEGLTITTNVGGSAFYMLTGFHGLHVTVGVLLLLHAAGMSAAGRIRQKDSLRIELTGLYWHFVDIVWVIIFTVVYLIPH